MNRKVLFGYTSGSILMLTGILASTHHFNQRYTQSNQNNSKNQTDKTPQYHYHHRMSILALTTTALGTIPYITALYYEEQRH